MQQGILYRVKCQLCLGEGKNSYYTGESARTGWDRGQDHLKALKNKDRKNALVEHWLDHHEGHEWSYKMEICQVFDRPLSRQVTEGYQIQNYKGDVVINRKGEWGCYVPPQLQVLDEKNQEDQPQQRAQKIKEDQGATNAIVPPSKKIKRSENQPGQATQFSQPEQNLPRKKTPEASQEDPQEDQINQANESQSQQEFRAKKSKLPKQVQARIAMKQRQTSDENRTMKGKEMVAYMLSLGTNNRGVISAEKRLLEPPIGQKKSPDLRSFHGVKGQIQIGESGVSLGEGEDQTEAQGSTSDEPIRTQFKTDQATIQIIVNSTTSLEATEEGISDQRVPQSQQGSLCNWTESESTIAEKG